MATSFQTRLSNSPEEAIKAPCVVSTPANITLSGEQTIASIAVIAGNRVLVRSQTDNTENGIYDASTGAWARSTDWNDSTDVINGMLVADASSSSDIIYKASFTGSYLPGTTAVTFVESVSSGLITYTGSIGVQSEYNARGQYNVKYIDNLIGVDLTSMNVGEEILVSAINSGSAGTYSSWMKVSDAQTSPDVATGVNADGFWYSALTGATKLRRVRQSQVDSIAALRLYKGDFNGQIVNTAGYYAGVIGGGGPVRWDATSTATDNGGTIFQVTGVTTGRWIRVIENSLNVAMFGAVGTADDAPFINAAILDAEAKGIREVYLAPGTIHNIGSMITVNSDTNYKITLKGSGVRSGQSRIKANAGFTGIMILLLQGEIDGFQLEGSDLTNAAHKGVEIGSASMTNPNYRIGNILYIGGLYDFIYSIYEYDTARIHDVICTQRVGHAVIWLKTSNIYPPAGSPTIERLHFNNPINAPQAGDSKVYGVVIDRTDGLSINNSIINNYDICLSLANGASSPKNYSLGLNGVHIEDHRTAIDNVWTLSQAQSVGDYITPTKVGANGHFYICTTAGTTAGTEPAWTLTDSGTVSDGTVIWTEVGYSVAIDSGQNEYFQINRLWSDGPLVAIRSVSTNSIKTTNSRIMAKSSVYLQVSGTSRVDFDNTLIDGDIRLEGGSVTTKYTASNSSVLNDSAGQVQDTTNGYYRNHSVISSISTTVTKTSDYTATDGDGVIFADATAGVVVITLPNSLTGKEITVYKFDNSANTVICRAPFNYLETGSTDHTLTNRGDSVKTLLRFSSNPIKLNVMP